MFILAWAFTAQPFASKMGPKLRRRNLNQANNIEGPETTIKSPKTTNGHCHHCSINNPEKVAAKAVPNAPIAKPKAAKIPAKRPISKRSEERRVGKEGRSRRE